MQLVLTVYADTPVDLTPCGLMWSHCTHADTGQWVLPRGTSVRTTVACVCQNVDAACEHLLLVGGGKFGGACSSAHAALVLQLV